MELFLNYTPTYLHVASREKRFSFSVDQPFPSRSFRSLTRGVFTLRGNLLWKTLDRTVAVEIQCSSTFFGPVAQLVRAHA